jgi:zinc transporter
MPLPSAVEDIRPDGVKVMTDPTEGLVSAYLKPPTEGWTEVGWEEVRNWKPEQGLLWVHLDAREGHARDYIHQDSDVDTLVQDVLLTRETRPRTVSMGDGLLAVFRGVNLNPGADPDDMVAIRVWAEPRRMISTTFRPLLATQTLREQMSSNSAPAVIGDLLLQLIGAMVDRMSAVIEELDDATDLLEDRVIESQSRQIRTELSHLRQQAIALRRHLAPQRDALSRLLTEDVEWLDKRRKSRLRETTDRMIRYVEDLDSIRERAAVIQDELMNRLSDQMNRNMYMLTIVATIMLPLGVFTGLLGINVDGMPGASDSPWAFSIVCLLLVFVVLIEIWLLRRLKWF